MATEEKVCGKILEFRPGMQSNMGLGQDGGGGDALWIKLVHAELEQVRTAGAGRPGQDLANHFGVIEKLSRRLPRINDELDSQLFHSFPCPSYESHVSIQKSLAGFGMGECTQNLWFSDGSCLHCKAKPGWGSEHNLETNSAGSSCTVPQFSADGQYCQAVNSVYFCGHEPYIIVTSRIVMVRLPKRSVPV